jgi:hypothetical protein
LIVLSLGRLRTEVSSEEIASGISLRSRPVKISAKFATWRVVCWYVTAAREKGYFTYSQVLLGRKNLTKKPTGANTQSVTQNTNFFDVCGSKRGNMRLEILSSVELEALSFEGKDLIGRSHSIRK